MRDGTTGRLCGPAIGALLLLAVSSGPTFAATAWTVAMVRGTVFSLIGSKWEEVAKGQEFAGEQVIRTLGSGRLQLDGAEGRIDLGAGTAIQLDASGVTQFSGSITVQTASGESLTVRANETVATIEGKALLRFDGKDVSVKVVGGTVGIADAAGKTVDLIAGQSLDVSEAGVAIASTGGGAANASGGNPNASPNAGTNGNGNSNAGGNGIGNAGGNGNEDAGGNGNGNAGGNGNGNAGGNGGGNENGNAGGNGNGNGNGKDK